MKQGIISVLMILAAALSFEACSSASGNHPGHEYMPDMGHSITQESNVYNEYSLHTWDKQSVKSLKDLSIPRVPVKGTIARGLVGMTASGNSDAMYAELSGGNRGVYTAKNGSVPYYYEDNEAERVRATKEIVGNPYPITKAGLARGKELYAVFCGICHGEKGGGNGYLARDGSKYLAQPANFLLDTFINGNNGRLYHAIMYGKNVMGAYADKMSYEERWQVIHYIRSCEAESKGALYNEKWNTFKPLLAVSDSMFQVTKSSKTKTESISVKKTPSQVPADPNSIPMKEAPGGK
jgi:mono/diheme cytochrome c family protein